MPCYHPVTGYRSRYINPSGKRSIVFSAADGYLDQKVEVPCGRCIGCRLEKSRQWAMRCVHESQLHAENCFITLTYDNNAVPDNFGLVKADFQKFMKRLRKAYGGKKIRYFMCGEYGEKNFRPHYHACLFGLDFADKVLWKETEGGRLYTSEQLIKLWPMGFSSIGDVTFDSAAYVARYVMKKVNGDKADEHYHRVNPLTGEYHRVIPEYCTMSRRPGIARDWYLRYHKDAYPSDFIVLNGKKMKPPKYYDQLHGDNVIPIKRERMRYAKSQKEENTSERLQVREHCKKAQIKQLRRALDED